MFENRFRNRSVVERINFQEAIAAGDDGILVRGRTGFVDDGVDLDAGILQAVDHEVGEGVLAKDV